MNIKTKGFQIDHKILICKDYLLKDIKNDVGVKDKDIVFNKDVLKFLIDTYTFEGGVRSLKKLCYEIIRELNLRNLKGNVKFPYKVTIKSVSEDLLKDKIKVRHEKIHNTPEVGKINGLYACAIGLGGITQIETKFIPHNDNFSLKLTGNQGNVMKESMDVAKSNAWNLLSETQKQTQNELSKKNGNRSIHIHCPEGATPKDGPSAGTAITIALYSLFINKPIKNNIAITGEIDLSMNVLEIGGLESKLFGAKKAGVKLALCPKQNEESLKKIKNEYPNLCDRSFNVKMVDNIQDVLDIVF
jgi:ATP-dependent Lon protease